MPFPMRTLSLSSRNITSRRYWKPRGDERFVTMAAPALLEFANVSLGYDRHAVLSGVNLKVDAGDCLGILGHNGSGKTTLIKAVLGLIQPLKGHLLIRGAGDSTPHFGYVPQKEK